jgi:hypothetical protein
MWQKNYGGSDFDEGYSIIQLGSGSFVFTGISNSIDGDVLGNHGNGDIWIVKIDSIGTILWQKCLGGSNTDSPSKICSTMSNELILCGNTNSNDFDISGNHGGYNDIWVSKLDSTGSIEWSRCFGGSNNECAFDIIENPLGGYTLGGYSNSNDGSVSGNHGNTDLWIADLDNYGLIKWQRSFGGSSAEFFEQEGEIVQVNSGNRVVCSTTYSSDGDVSGNHGQQDIWLLVLDTLGNIISKNCLGGTNDEIGNSIDVTKTGQIYISGYSNSIDGDLTNNHGYTDIWLAKLSNNLNTFINVYDISEEQIKIYPNPAETVVILELRTFNPENVEIIIKNSIGQDIYYNTKYLPYIGEQKIEININNDNIIAGSYLIQVRTASNLISRRFIKQ